MNKLELEGKQNIVTALNNIGLDYDNMISIKNKCSDCPYKYIFLENQYCALDNRVTNAYGCNEHLLGNNAEELKEYPDDEEDR